MKRIALPTLLKINCRGWEQKHGDQSSSSCNNMREGCGWSEDGGKWLDDGCLLKVVLIIPSLLPIGNHLFTPFLDNFQILQHRSGQEREHLVKNNLKEFRYSMGSCTEKQVSLLWFTQMAPQVKEGCVAPLLMRREALAFWFNVCEHQRKACPPPHKGPSLTSAPSKSPKGYPSFLVYVQDIYFRRH